jgi:Domain of unknown function (DUF4178)
MKLRLRDVISYQGQDLVVEAILTYRLGAKSYPLVRAVDGDDVRWVEPLLGDLDDRYLFFKEVRDLPLSTPPPSTVSYKGASYVPRLSGTASVEVEGNAASRQPGPCEIWRYRAAGDVFLQIEKWPNLTTALAGESVHKDMVEIFPAPGAP